MTKVVCTAFLVLVAAREAAALDWVRKPTLTFNESSKTWQVTFELSDFTDVNEILRFGTYGNRDSMGGLKGDLVPTEGIPLGWPNSVDASDDTIYVGDVVNNRLLRIAKTFAAEAFAP